MFEDEFLRGTLTPLLAIVGAFFGLLGTGIGVWNWWLNRKSHSFAVEVKASGGKHFDIQNAMGKPVAECDEMLLHLTITNHSYFPVSVERLGVAVRRGRFSKTEYISLPFSAEAGTRIESRSSARFSVGAMCTRDLKPSSLFALCQKSPPTSTITRGAYVTLVTGQTFVGAAPEVVNVLSKIEEWTPKHVRRLQDERDRDAAEIADQKKFVGKILGIRSAPDEPPTDAR
jgi:hypothetical protein